MKIPTKLYRFMCFDGLNNTIKNKMLRFSRADTFNDPLDCSHLLFPIDLSNLPLNRSQLDNYKEYLFDNVYGSVYICCFSKIYKSEKAYLMWAHYGNSHKNVCFEFNWSKISEINGKYLGGPEEVEYSEDLEKSRNSALNYDLIKLGEYLVLTKSDMWRYEEEARFIVDIKSKQEKKGFIEKVDNEHIDVKFFPEAITKIIFGMNAKEKDKERTIKTCNEIGIKPLFVELFIDTETLKLEEKKYSR